jgi:hypothetical protein
MSGVATNVLFGSFPSSSSPGAHFATFPQKLVERMILSGCPIGGIVLDPFGGAGTVGLVPSKLQRNAILIDLYEKYIAMARARIQQYAGLVCNTDWSKRKPRAVQMKKRPPKTNFFSKSLSRLEKR